MELCGSEPELEFSPLCMDAWQKGSVLDRQEVLAVGDIGGRLSLYRLVEHESKSKKSDCRCVCLLV